MQHGKLLGYNSIGRRESPGKFPGIPLKGLISASPSYGTQGLQMNHGNITS